VHYDPQLREAFVKFQHDGFYGAWSHAPYAIEDRSYASLEDLIGRIADQEDVIVIGFRHRSLI